MSCSARVSASSESAALLDPGVWGAPPVISVGAVISRGAWPVRSASIVFITSARAAASGSSAEP